MNICTKLHYIPKKLKLTFASTDVLWRGVASVLKNLNFLMPTLTKSFNLQIMINETANRGGDCSRI